MRARGEPSGFDARAVTGRPAAPGTDLETPSMTARRPSVGILTSGGDCPGLNAVIRAAVKTADRLGYDCVGFLRGFEGLADPVAYMPLNPRNTAGILLQGGTILGSTNKGRFSATVGEDQRLAIDRGLLDEAATTIRQLSVCGLVCVGGDGSLAIAQQLLEHGLPVVGVPKTIDNDVVGTESTFGFDTAVATATEALDKLHSTAESHDRVMVVELMGRYAGWISLHSGLSGSADVILIPEIPFDIEKVCDKIRARELAGRNFSIVVVAEGARPRDGKVELLEEAKKGSVERLGGIAARVAHAITERTGKETRSLVLGHLQRGGSPTTFDRLLALRFGSAAVRAIGEGDFGSVVVYTPPTVSRRPITDVMGRQKLVPMDSGIILTARNLGISFGD